MKKNIALITGNFNVLHSGHIRLFEFAKNEAKELVVGIISSNNSKLDSDKILNLKNCKLVDRVELISSIPKFILK